MKKAVDNANDMQSEEKTPVKKPRRKAVDNAIGKVVESAQKLEKGIREKKAEILDEKMPQLELEKKLYKSLTSKKQLIIEHYGKQVSEEMIIDKLVLKLEETGFKGNIKTINIYYKVEEETAYCVINNGEPIVIKIFE